MKGITENYTVNFNDKSLDWLVYVVTARGKHQNQDKAWEIFMLNWMRTITVLDPEKSSMFMFLMFCLYSL